MTNILSFQTIAFRKVYQYRNLECSRCYFSKLWVFTEHTEVPNLLKGIQNELTKMTNDGEFTRSALGDYRHGRC